MARVAALWVLSRRASPSANDPEHPVGLPLEGFTEKAAAEAAQKVLERAAREQTPVGSFLKRLATKRAADIADAARAAGLPPLDLSAIGPEVRPMRAGNTTYSKDNTNRTAAYVFVSGHDANTTAHPKEYAAYCARASHVVSAWWESVAAEITPSANAALWDALFPNHTFYAISRALFEA